MKKLITRKADIHHCDVKGRTALGLAAFQGDAEVSWQQTHAAAAPAELFLCFFVFFKSTEMSFEFNF